MLRSTAQRMSHGSGHEGQTLPLVVCFLLVLLLMCGCVVDFGNAYRVPAQLQASTDAAAPAAPRPRAPLPGDPAPALRSPPGTPTAASRAVATRFRAPRTCS